MKARKKIFLIILFILFKPLFSLASHAIGGEITYECLSANQYKIKLILYRDCSGINLSSVQTIRISNSCGFVNIDTLSVAQVGNPQIFSSVCSTAPNTCFGGTEFGMARYNYEGTINLPGSCSDWTFSHTVVNRNIITTTVGSASDSLYIYSLINNQNSICNNSPEFFNAAAGVYYIGYPACYTNGAYDIDGDSLSFELTTPRTGPSVSDTVTYLNGYSYSNPVSSSVPINFISVSGELCFIPSQTEVSVFAMIISEYRNGVLIGKTLRDIQLRPTPDPVPNTPPVLSGINGTNVFNIDACPGSAVITSIYAFDPDTSEDLTVYWDQGISNGTWTSFSTTNSNSDSAHFSWIPLLSDVSSTPHCFTVYVHDDHCPYTGVDSQLYCITVYPPTDPFCINPGINESMNTATFQAYPNPVHDALEINMRSNLYKQNYLMMFNSTGQKIYTVEFTSGKTVLDVSGWQRGVYECILISGDDKYSQRIIIQ